MSGPFVIPVLAAWTGRSLCRSYRTTPVMVGGIDMWRVELFVRGDLVAVATASDPAVAIRRAVERYSADFES